MLVFHYQNVEQNYSTKIAKSSFEIVAKLNYMEVT
jgi:hypothetical protein